MRIAGRHSDPRCPATCSDATCPEGGTAVRIRRYLECCAAPVDECRTPRPRNTALRFSPSPIVTTCGACRYGLVTPCRIPSSPSMPGPSDDRRPLASPTAAKSYIPLFGYRRPSFSPGDVEWIRAVCSNPIGVRRYACPRASPSPTTSRRSMSSFWERSAAGTGRRSLDHMVRQSGRFGGLHGGARSTGRSGTVVIVGGHAVHA